MSLYLLIRNKGLSQILKGIVHAPRVSFKTLSFTKLNIYRSLFIFAVDFIFVNNEYRSIQRSETKLSDQCKESSIFVNNEYRSR